ncbi:MAG: DUF4293 family protein [Chitinophagales bacterium]|nr:DUF4293 family protein [Chitinophagales bacterium]
MIGMLAAVLSLLLLIVPVMYNPQTGGSRSIYEMYIYHRDGEVYRIFLGGIGGSLLILFSLLNLLFYRSPKNQAITSLITFILSVLVFGIILFKYFTFKNLAGPASYFRFSYGAIIPLLVAMLMLFDYLEAKKATKTQP